MNQLQSLLFAASLYTNPVQPQTFYISYLSETDGSKAGEYISVTSMPIVQPILQPITPMPMPSLDLQDSGD